jgi:hypothetical protein
VVEVVLLVNKNFFKKEHHMKNQFFAAILSTGFLSLPAFADHVPGHNDADEVTRVSCQVLGADGTALPITSSDENFQDDKMTFMGEGEIFSYSVELAKATGKLKLVDKRNGHQVMVSEGDYDLNEKVSVTHIPNNDPALALTLECTAL